MLILPSCLVLLLATDTATASFPPIDFFSLSPSPVPSLVYGIRLPALSFCPAQISEKLALSAKRATYLTRAALNSASNFTTPPYNYFFPSTLSVANDVSALFATALEVLEGTGGPRIRVYCADLGDKCNDHGVGFGPRIGGPPVWIIRYGYVREDLLLKGETAIVICQDEFKTTVYNPAPCSNRGGGLYTSEWILLNLVLQAIDMQAGRRQQASSSSSSSLRISAAGGAGNKLNANNPTAIDCHNYLLSLSSSFSSSPQANNNNNKQNQDPKTSNPPPINQVNCLADLASWAWDLGFGMPPEWDEDKTCLVQTHGLELFATQTYSKGDGVGGLGRGFV